MRHTHFPKQLSVQLKSRALQYELNTKNKRVLSANALSYTVHVSDAYTVCSPLLNPGDLITILDKQGRCIFSTLALSNALRIETSSWTAGQFLLRILPMFRGNKIIEQWLLKD